MSAMETLDNAIDEWVEDRVDDLIADLQRNVDRGDIGFMTYGREGVADPWTVVSIAGRVDDRSLYYSFDDADNIGESEEAGPFRVGTTFAAILTGDVCPKCGHVLEV